MRCGMAAGEEKGLAVTSTVIPSPAKRFLIHYCKGDGSMTQGNPFDSKQRIIQEFVPGKQVTMAHPDCEPQ